MDYRRPIWDSLHLRVRKGPRNAGPLSRRGRIGADSKFLLDECGGLVHNDWGLGMSRHFHHRRSSDRPQLARPWSTRARQQAAAKAHAHVQRALALDPDNADAHMTSAGLMLMERRFDGAEAEVRKALELAPGSAGAGQAETRQVGHVRRAAEAVALRRKAMALNPNYPANYLGNCLEPRVVLPLT